MNIEALQRCSNGARKAKGARDRAAREWLIVNALETFGPHLSLRQLGRQTNMDQTTLASDLRNLERAGVASRETMPLKFHAKSPTHVWSLKP
jgi:DNA-binding HxlR family transcriptional regulator